MFALPGSAMDVLENMEGDNVLNLSRMNLDTVALEEISEEKKNETQQLLLTHNRFTVFPGSIAYLRNLLFLDISSNGLTFICDGILELTKLKTLIAKNNRMDEFSLPKDLGKMGLEVVNFSGNRFEEVPSQLLELQRLKSLSLGGNRLKTIPPQIENLTSCQYSGQFIMANLPTNLQVVWLWEETRAPRGNPCRHRENVQTPQQAVPGIEPSLELLYLGGNGIISIPPELANLPYLSYLGLCDNRIQGLPPQLAQLNSLRSLSLHNNLLTYLPREILNLVHLQELSLRGNPLVVRFVKDLLYNPPSLLELAGRIVKSRNLCYTLKDMPGNLVNYLDSASKCPNPKCAGVYFDSCVRHIKFVDFCGKYRLPLMHYLCSPQCFSPCSSNSQSDCDSEDEFNIPQHRMQKVLLG
ncbi:leucine-rich repeat-containing protein 58 isoform X1 [Heterodontus francisci]|uniref:leucine-rich repeat-containing protein 58 isoform X1 n=1 Tax=Heterodontus francisci TaxID=7792 RepID=UPI00355AD757